MKKEKKSLLCFTVGDALGVPYEFKRRKQLENCKIDMIVCVKYSLANFLTFFFYHCFLFFCITNKPRLCTEQAFSI